MSRQLPSDCLNEIFEHLEDDKVTLCSCLLVNRLWCESAVRILWKNVWNVKYSHQSHVPLAIISTLITCLLNESKDLLCKNGISIATQTWKLSLFNYASFCKVLSIHKIDRTIQHFLENQQFIILSQSLEYEKYLLLQEICKMFMSEISSLKSLDYYLFKIQDITFTLFPGARNCLKDLTELKCNSNSFEFFYQLSKIQYVITYNH